MTANQTVDQVATSIISRVVAALAAPISAGVAAGLLWLQNVVGIDLQQYKGAAVAFLGTVILGGCLTAYKWLEGRAAWEQAVAIGEKLYHAGSGSSTARY